MACAHSEGVLEWSCIGHFLAMDGDADQLAQDQELSYPEVVADLVYFRRNEKRSDAGLVMTSTWDAHGDRLSDRI